MTAAPLRAVVACAGCQAAILWAVTSLGKRMPLDAAPAPDGTMVLLAGKGAAPLALVADRLRAGAATDEPRYRPHWVTCPMASRFRKPRKAAP